MKNFIIATLMLATPVSASDIGYCTNIANFTVIVSTARDQGIPKYIVKETVLENSRPQDLPLAQAVYKVIDDIYSTDLPGDVLGNVAFAACMEN